jgi:hypothetical protein
MKLIYAVNIYNEVPLSEKNGCVRLLIVNILKNATC